MKVFFFGAPDSPLFGVLHSPSSTAGADHGVVLCYPAGHEYYRAHRAFRHLAQRLARHGVYALRFDYRGSGDSAGDSDAAGIAAWSEDLSAAIETLRARTRVVRISLVGRGLGANLAALRAAGRSDIASLVLWDPIVEGGAHLAALRSAHREFATQPRGRSSATIESPSAMVTTVDGSAEYLGQVYPRSFLDELERLDLGALAPPLSSAVLIIDSSEVGMPPPVRGRLAAAIGARTEFRHLADPTAAKLQELLAQYVPNVILEEIVAWLRKEAR